MNTQQAIELLQTSDLPEGDKQRLVQLIQDRGWSNEVEEEVLSTIRRATSAAQEELTNVTQKTDAYEAQVTAEEKRLADEAAAQMDQAVADYNLEMAKLEQEADQLAADAKKAEE